MIITKLFSARFFLAYCKTPFILLPFIFVMGLILSSNIGKPNDKYRVISKEQALDRMGKIRTSLSRIVELIELKSDHEISVVQLQHEAEDAVTHYQVVKPFVEHYSTFDARTFIGLPLQEEEGSVDDEKELKGFSLINQQIRMNTGKDLQILYIECRSLISLFETISLHYREAEMEDLVISEK